MSDRTSKEKREVKLTRFSPLHKQKEEKRKEKPIRASKTAIGNALKQMFGNREFFYQSYADDKENSPLPPVWKRVHLTPELVVELAEISDKGMNVGVVPNVMDGKGRSKQNCVEIRWLFADFDQGEHTLKGLLAMPVEPTFIVETSPGRFHVYWRVEGCAVENFAPIQKAIAAKLGSDRSVSDPSRCMRIPGTVNYWYGEPFRARVVFPSGRERGGHRTKVDKFIAAMGLQVQAAKSDGNGSGKNDDESLTDDQILALLEKIDPTDRNVWREVGMALHSRYPDKHGRHIWDKWAMQCADKFDLDDQRKEWAEFKSDGGITVGTLVHLAQKDQPSTDVPTNELELAEALAIHGVGHIRFGKVGQSWWHFENGTWHETKGAHGALKYARALMLELSDRVNGSPQTRQLLPAATLRAAVNMAQLDPRLEIDELLLDADPYLLGVKNGVIDLRTGTFRAAAPNDFLTKQTNVAFDPSAKCPQFQKALKQICRGRKDLGCVFHAIPDTHFTGSRTAFHADGGHDFTLMADSVSR